MEGYVNQGADVEAGTGVEKVNFQIQEEQRPKPKLCTNTSLCLFAVILLLIVAIVILTIGILSKGFGTWKDPESTVCETGACAQASARITYNMDETVDPCKDFYKYACGGFEKKSVLSQSTAQLGSWNKAGEQLTIEMKKLLETASSIDNLNVVKQAKVLYRSCMNETAIDLLGTKPILDLINKLGGWAALKADWDESSFNLETYMIQMGELGQRLVVYGVDSDPYDTSKRIIIVGQGSVPFSVPVYGVQSFLTLYKQTLIDLATALGGDANTIKMEIPKMVDFEVELAKISQTDLTIRPTPEQMMTLDQTGNEFPGIDIKRLLTSAFAGVNIQLNGNIQLYVKHKNYLKKLGVLVGQTAKRTLATYIMFGAFRDTLVYVDSKTRGIVDNLKMLLTGTRGEAARYTICTATVNSFLPFTLTRLFVDEYFKQGTADIEIMASFLKQTFLQRLAEEEWLDETSRNLAEIKANAMILMLGYPDHILNDEKLNEETKITDMKQDTFFDNVIKIATESTKTSMTKLLRPADRVEWSYGSPLQINAFHAFQRNNIVFPVGILRPPFYDPSGPKSINYGAIGMTIGHEITHGYDSFGRFFDKDGNSNEWMMQTAIDSFNNKSQCFEEQYSGIVIEQLGRKVDGKLTLGENIADAGGIKQAFQAYQKWVAENGPEKSLPGLNMTHDQLYFVSFAQLYCSLFTLQTVTGMAQNDNHTPHKERVFGVLINSDDFAKTYNCPLDSRMNPRKKCSVW